MIRVFVLFVALAMLFAVVITGVRQLKGEELWQLTKLVGFSIVCSALATITMLLIVFLF